LAHTRVLLYSRSNRFGKTKTVSQIPKCLLILTEDGADYYETFNVRINTWVEFVEIIKSLKEDKQGFETVAIDTIDGLAALCRDHWMGRNPGMAISDNWHRGAGEVEEGFRARLEQLGSLGLGVWMLGRAQDISKDNEPSRLELKMPRALSRCRDTVQNFAHTILFADINNGTRVLYADELGSFVAGDRSERLPGRIELRGKNENYKIIKEHYESNRDASRNSGRTSKGKQVGNLESGELHSKDNGNARRKKRTVRQMGVDPVQGVE
jgi:hypothetical protein